jgi:beta-mannosidase
MVWQDFSMACFNYPCDEKMENAIREEATAIVREYRHHPSIILWSGDNEIDVCVRKKRAYSLPTSTNTLTRKILPYVIERNDIGRPYLASSPFLTDEAVFDHSKKSSEEHLWGSRDYFKSYEYLSCPAHFLSECGYHGCPDPESIKKFITPEKVWPYFDNDEWTLHSADQDHNDSRVMLMHNQVLQLFGEVPDNLADYAIASQISQAEEFKYLIERMRVKRPIRSGIIWWNLLDGWPQMSDAVVDYYYNKKLAYDYIKRAQAPFAVCADELAKWKLRIYACNDTQEKKQGHLRIFDIDTDETLAELDFHANANTSTELAALSVFYSEKRFLVFEWEIDGKKNYNHYLCGYPAFDLAKYREWIKKYQALTGFCEFKKL